MTREHPQSTDGMLQTEGASSLKPEKGFILPSLSIADSLTKGVELESNPPTAYVAVNTVASGYGSHNLICFAEILIYEHFGGEGKRHSLEFKVNPRHTDRMIMEKVALQASTLLKHGYVLYSGLRLPKSFKLADIEDRNGIKSFVPVDMQANLCAENLARRVEKYYKEEV